MTTKNFSEMETEIRKGCGKEISHNIMKMRRRKDEKNIP